MCAAITLLIDKMTLCGGIMVVC